MARFGAVGAPGALPARSAARPISAFMFLLAPIAASATITFTSVSFVGSHFGHGADHVRYDPTNTIVWPDGKHVACNGNASTMVSADGGITWAHGFAGSVPGNIAVNETTFETTDLGVTTYYDTPTSSFKTDLQYRYTLNATGGIDRTELKTAGLTFTGLPRPVYEFSIESGGVATLPNGTRVMLVVVWFADTDAADRVIVGAGPPGPCPS